MNAVARQWGDLPARVISAAIMVVVGGGAIWAGGVVFQLLCLAAIGAMGWELGRMVGGLGAGLTLGAAAAGGLAVALNVPHDAFIALGVILPGLLSLALPGGLRAARAPYLMVIVAAGVMLVVLRGYGVVPVVWLVAVVVASDVLGYFVGRSLGGPKVWPAISPKKTWSGTVAGWVGGAMVSALISWLSGAGGGGAPVVALHAGLGALVAFGGQMGDIAESWFKRRVGVKDSSRLIPGHGGVLDRFDALIFGAVLVGALAYLLGRDAVVG